MGLTLKQKVLLWLGLSGTVILYTSPIFKAAKTGSNLIVEFSGRIHRVDSKGLTLAVDVKMKNPTAYSLTFLYPFVRLVWNNSDLMSSVVSAEEKTLEKFGELNFPIYFQLSFMNLFTNVPALFSEYTKKGELSLTVVTTTKVLASDGARMKPPIPIEKTEVIKFGKTQPAT